MGERVIAVQWKTRARWLQIVLVLVLAPLGILSLFRGVQKAIRAKCDLEAFWVASVLIVEGKNPYRMFLEEQELLLDQYAVSDRPWAVCTLPLTERPVYNLPMQPLLMSPLGLLSFSTANVVWLVIQVAMALAIPLLLLGLNPRPPSVAAQVAGVSLFLAWAPTRMTLALGQITLLSGLFGFLAVWLVYRRSDWWLLAGVCMGIALSKYTNTWPLLLFLLVHRHYRAAIVAVLTQVAGFLLLSLVTGEAPIDVIGSYFALLRNALGQDLGVISLDGWLNMVGLRGAASALLAAGAAAVILLTLVLPEYVHKRARDQQMAESAVYRRVRANLFIVTTFLIGFLFVYHRAYDLPLLFGYVSLVSSLDLSDEANKQDRRLYFALLAAAALLNLVLLSPPSALEEVFPEPLSTLLGTIPITLSLAATLAVCIWASLQPEVLRRLVPGEKETGQTLPS